MSEEALILVVDDIIDNTRMVAETLNVFGYETLTANGGQQALDIVYKTPNISLIILDIMMPGVGGLDVCKQLKANPETQDIPIIFMSSLTESENIVAGLKAGGVDYIGKPFNISETIARVKTHLKLRQQHKELKERYAEIDALQQMVRKFISQNTWINIQAEVKNETHTDIIREYEVMTLMFTDIAHFTTISEKIDSQTLLAELTFYMQLLTTIIHKHNGQVDKFLGDGLFAFFVDATDAKNAAVEMQKELHRFNDDLQENGHEVFITRIGLATGDVLQAIFGFDERLEHTIIGDKVNVAARLESEAPLGGIMMDEATFQAIGNLDNVTERLISLKGKSENQLTYSITAEQIMNLM